MATWWCASPTRTPGPRSGCRDAAGCGWTPPHSPPPSASTDGLAAALAAAGELPLMLRADMAWLRGLRHRWEAVANPWNQHVLGYNPERQRELLARIGLGAGRLRRPSACSPGRRLCCSPPSMPGACAARACSDPLARTWERFCAKMAGRRPCRARPGKGRRPMPRSWPRASPRKHGELHEICALYARLRYGPHAPEQDLRILQNRIASLRLK